MKIILWLGFVIFSSDYDYTYTADEYYSVADLHGDLKAATDALLLTKLVDHEFNWIGGNRILVQTGDIVDRGPETREIYDLFVKLRKQAEQAGGRVIQLLGNHEVMNLQGNYYYVDPTEYAHWSISGLDPQEGKVLREKAWDIDGDYGTWLRKLPMAAVVNRTLFCHAGVDIEWAEKGLDNINRISSELLQKEQTGEMHPLFSVSGPVWTRAFDPIYSGTGEKIMCEKVERVLSILNVDRMVTGHNVQLDNVAKTYCDGKLLTLDVGMSSYYGSGRAVFHHGPEGVEIISPQTPPKHSPGMQPATDTNSLSKDGFLSWKWTIVVCIFLTLPFCSWKYNDLRNVNYESSEVHSFLQLTRSKKASLS